MNEIKLTKGIISREEALAISTDYVLYAEGNHDLWDKVMEQFEGIKKGDLAITAHPQDGKHVFVRVKVTSVDHDDIRAIDGPVVRVSNGEYSWRVDGDRYAFIIPKVTAKTYKRMAAAVLQNENSQSA